MDTSQQGCQAEVAATAPADRESSRRLLGELLVGEGLITRDQLADALRVQQTVAPRRRLGWILVDQEVLTWDQLNTVLRGAILARGERGDQKSRLGAILMEANVLTEDQLEVALKLQRKMGLRLGEVLLQLDYVAEAKIKEALCQQVGVQFVDPQRIKIEGSTIDLIGRRYAVLHRVIPVSKEGSTITVLMADPTNVQVVKELQASTGCQIRVVTSTQAGFQRALKKTYGDGL